MRADGKPPSPGRAPSLTPRGGGLPGDPEERASMALHGQLIDPATTQRTSVDPLVHLEGTAPREGNGIPTQHRANGTNDDELAGIFDDDPEADQVPSLLDPVQNPPNDPLAMLNQHGHFPSTAADRVPLPQALPAADTPPDGGEALIPAVLSGRGEPRQRPSLSLIPDSWDPVLAVTGRSSAAVPLLPNSVPSLTGSHDADLLLNPSVPTSDAAGALRHPLLSPVPVPEAAEPRTPDPLTLLLRREAARGSRVDRDAPKPLAISPAPDRPSGNLVTRPSLFGAAPPALEADELGPGPVPVADDVLSTFWRALGVDPARMSAADQQRLLIEIAQMTREVADGLIQILAARKHLRSEFRVDQTMVGATQNNLFKFTRNVDELLSLTVTNRNHVFLPMDQAAREAFNDIKAHEMATLAAVQLSIRAVLDRFQPTKLARQAEEQPRGRLSWRRLRSAKARCWEFFTRMYTELAADADEASNRIFTVEFGRAYRERTTKNPNR